MGKHQQEGHQPGATWRLCRWGQLQAGRCPGADGAGLARPGRHKVWGQTDQAERDRVRTEDRLGVKRGAGEADICTGLLGTLKDAPTLQPPPFSSLTHSGRRDRGLYPCQGDCNPDSVALWFARDEIHSHPVATVEQMQPAKGMESLLPPK